MLIKIKCIGAGDVKLIMATSMLIGARRVLMIFLGTSILTLPYTVLLFIKKGIFRERINCFVNYVGKCSVEKRLLEYDMDAPRVPFAIFMFWGAVLERVFAIAGGLVRW
jgi:Flp pilus assembly protein protease CpaA